MRVPTKSGAAFFIELGLCLAGFVPFHRALAGAEREQEVVNQTREKVRVPDPLDQLRTQADAALEKKEFAAAAQAYEQYLSSRPNDAVTHFQLGYAYVALKRWAEAENEYRKAATLDPKMAAAYHNLGLILLGRDPAAAVEPFRKEVELQPDEADPHSMLGVALERSGKLADAVEQYQAAARLDPKNFRFHYDLASALLAMNRAPEAEVAFRRALELRPNAVRARTGLAESLLAQKKTEEGIRELAAYLQSQPQDHEARLRLASVLVNSQKYDQALAELDRVEASPQAALPVYRLRAEIYVGQKNYAAASATLEKAVALAPHNAELRARLGRVWLEQRNFRAAERELNEALRLDSGLTETLRDLMASYYLDGNYAAALAALDQLAQRETPPPVSWFVRATCYDHLGRKTEALEAYQKFLALDQGQHDRDEFQARNRIEMLEHELGKKKR